MIYFGIPTYHRHERQPTLEWLERCGVRKEQIVMSVQCEEDYALYKKYASRVGAYIFQPGKNLSDNINTILEYVPRNERIVIFDDDIKTISYLNGEKLEDINDPYKFEKFFEYGYGIADKHKTIGFSVYPVHNAYFMSMTYNIKHIGEGTLLALTNTGLMFDRRFDTKCDYEFTCRVIEKYGAYPRLNMFSCKAPHYTKGGCETFWEDRKKVLWDASSVIKMHPLLVRENTRREGEILMKPQRDKVKVSAQEFFC